MTVPHQSYYELKKDTSEDFARRTLLYNLRGLKNNIRACAREMRCSPHTVYLALKKQTKGDLKDASHRPKRKHPRHISNEKEQMIIDYRKKTNYGKRHLQYHIHSKEKISIPESTSWKSN